LFVFETVSHCVAHIDLKLTVLLPSDS
jgi:hypothetical protein